MTSIPLRRADAETPWQRVTNWLAVLILLGLGFVSGPSDLVAPGLAAAGARHSSAEAGVLAAASSAPAAAGSAAADPDASEIVAPGDVAAPRPDIANVRAVSL